eukprot:m.444340 g.444340  ORF g.444340 m.444340 type:complete len:277 (+) comp21489_c0_seq11:206-1036(+)
MFREVLLSSLLLSSTRNILAEHSAEYCASRGDHSSDRDSACTALRAPALDLWWFGPVLSGGGYCSEALAFTEALHQSVRKLKITQHGDEYNALFFEGLTKKRRKFLQNHMKTTIDIEATVVVCHSEPGAWNPPRYETTLCPPAEDALYTIGRTMFETDTIPSEWVNRCNAMDEIWVPTEFHRQTFAAAGVLPTKLVVIPEPVDVDRFTPDLAWPKNRQKLLHRLTGRAVVGCVIYNVQLVGTMSYNCRSTHMNSPINLAVPMASGLVSPSVTHQMI